MKGYTFFWKINVCQKSCYQISIKEFFFTFEFFYKMLIPIAILVTLLLRNVQALVKCNGIVTKLQLCSLHENYNKGVVGTGAEEFQFPLTINSSITLIDIAEFDENKNTITLQVVLSIRWHAATMELESNNNKYVFSIQLVDKRIVHISY